MKSATDVFALKKFLKDIFNSEICYTYDKLVTGPRVVQFREKSCSYFQISDFQITLALYPYLYAIQSYGAKSHMLVSKLQSGTSKTKQLVPVHLDLPLFWKSHCATCPVACMILYYVTGSCKGPNVLHSVQLLLFISSRMNNLCVFI